MSGFELPDSVDVETEKHRGRPYPAPGAWELSTVEMDNTAWVLNPERDGNGLTIPASADAHASLVLEGEMEHPVHVLTIDCEEIQSHEVHPNPNTGEFTPLELWSEGGLWIRVADALAEYAADADTEDSDFETIGPDPIATDTADRDCLMEQEWCDGPDVEDLLCGECCIQRAKERAEIEDRDAVMEHLTYNIATEPAGVWERKAAENIENWGQQNPDALILAMMEELGELAHELIKHYSLGESGADAEHGRKLTRAVATLGDSVQGHLETVSEDADGEPIPPADRPEYFSPELDVYEPEEGHRALGSELADLMALGHQFQSAIQSDSEDADSAGQATLSGEPVPALPCRGCENDATRVLTLRGMSEDKLFLCDECDFPDSVTGTSAGVTSEKPLTPKERAKHIQTDGGVQLNPNALDELREREEKVSEDDRLSHQVDIDKDPELARTQAKLRAELETLRWAIQTLTGGGSRE